MREFVQVRGKKFYKGDEEILFKGIGIGSWLNLEHFMMGIPGNDFQIRQSFADVYGKEAADRFFDRLVREFVSEEDFRFMKELGINLVRVPFNYRLFMEDEKPGEWRQEGFAYFDYLFRMAEKYEIYVLPDLHTVPGGQNPDWHSDNGTGYTLFWQYGIFRQQMVMLWKEIAARYRDEVYLLGYDILNEPFIIPDRIDTGEGEDMATGFFSAQASDFLPNFYAQVTEAIRSVDDKHIIFVEGDHFASDFDCLRGIADEQTALTFHYYPTVWYADLYDKDYDRKERAEKFEEVFRRLIRIREEFARPILCGEAGYEIATNGMEDTLPLIELTFRLFRKYAVSFTLWSYKDACFMGLVYPQQDSEWMQLAEKIRVRWDHHRAERQAMKGLEALLDGEYMEAGKEDRYILAFRQRALLYPLEQKYILKPLLAAYSENEMMKLPEAFRFENCGYHEEFARIYREFSFYG